MEKLLEDINIYELQESLLIESSFNNLMMDIELLTEEEQEKVGTMGKLTGWVKGSLVKTKSKLTQTMQSIKKAVSKLDRNARDYEKYKKLRILNDIQAYSRFTQFISSSKSYRIAKYDANKVAAFANYSLKAEMNGNRIAKLQSIVKKELSSKKFNKLRYELDNFSRVLEGDNAQAMLNNMIQNLGAAASKLDYIGFSLINSIERLERGAQGALKKLERIKAAPGLRTSRTLPGTSVLVQRRKKDRRANLFMNGMAVVSYANKQLTNIVVSTMNKIEQIIEKFTRVADSYNNKTTSNTINNSQQEDEY